MHPAILDGKRRELRNLIPDEIKKYQTIINNKDAILDDARQKAHTLIDDAQIRRNELINEHEVMRQAYEQAGEVVKSAAEQARDLLDDAQLEANGMKEAAVQYTDRLLQNVEKTLKASIQATNTQMGQLLKEYESLSETVSKNRAALTMPETLATDKRPAGSGAPGGKDADEKEEVIPNTRIIRNEPQSKPQEKEERTTSFIPSTASAPKSMKMDMEREKDSEREKEKKPVKDRFKARA